MLKDSRFAKDVDEAVKLLEKAQKSLDSIKQYINDGNKEFAVKESFNYERICENIVNNARLLPVNSGVPNMKNVMINLIIENSNVDISYTNEGWFHITIPSILPKKESGNPSYIRATLHYSMKEFFNKNDKKRIKDDCIIIFKHNYSSERHEREYRDHDNIEVNAVVDIIALFCLVDDSPMRCKHYYLSSVSDSDNTEVFIVPNKDFIKWIQIYNN